MTDERPDGGMGSDTETGWPARTLDDDDLDPEERRLLEELRRPGPRVVDPVEESIRVARSAEDDTPL